jgi:hypothetical protein
MNRSKKIVTETRQREIGLNEYERNEGRRMERVKYDRFKYQLERGYNPVNLTNDLPVPLYGAAPQSMWDRLQRNDSSGGFTGLGVLSLPVPVRREAPATAMAGLTRSVVLDSQAPSPTVSSSASHFAEEKNIAEAEDIMYTSSRNPVLQQNIR